MADQTITISRVQIKRSKVAGRRPDALADGEEFVNHADGIRMIGDGSTPAIALPEYPLRPGIDDVPGLPDALGAAARKAAALSDMDANAVLSNLGLVNVVDRLLIASFGILGDDSLDDAPGLRLYAAWCRNNGRAFILPKARVRYKLLSTVDLRGLWVHATDSDFRIDHDGIGLIVGGNSAFGTNPDARLASFVRATGRSTVNPELRVIGAKGANIHWKNAPFVQVWADPAVPADASLGYSNFYFNAVGKLHLDTPATPVVADQGWINENQFWGNRITGELVIRGTYRHNHCKFYNLSMENTTLIDIDNASDIKIFGLRAEKGPTTIRFGANTERCVIYRSWVATPQGGPNSFFDSGTITDLGKHNKVLNENAMYHDATVVASADISEVVINNRTGAGSGLRNRAPQLQRVAGAGTNSELMISPFLPAVRDDWYVWAWEWADDGDAPLYRPVVAFFDKNLQPKAADPTFLIVPGTWSASGNLLRPGSNQQSGRYATITAAAIAAGVAFVRVSALGSPGVATGSLARRLSILNYSTNRIDKIVGVARDSDTSVAEPLVTAMPTQGFAPQGFRARKSDNTAIYHCTFAVETAATAAAASGTVVSVASVVGLAVGDVIGVNMDSRDTHWAKIASISGADITITVTLPAAVSVGARVVFNRWATQALTLT